MNTESAATCDRGRALTGTIAGLVSVVLDCIVVISAVLIARAIVLASPLQDPSLRQWAFERYRDSGLLLGAVYLVMLWAGGMISGPESRDYARIPLRNLLNCVLLFCIGLLACWYYGVRNEGQPYIARRVLFFSTILIYAVTTVIHYVSARLQSDTGNKAEELKE